MNSLQFPCRFLSVMQLIEPKGKLTQIQPFSLTDAGKTKTPWAVFRKDFTTTNDPVLPTRPPHSPLPPLIHRGRYCNKTSDLSENKWHKKILTSLSNYKLAFFHTSTTVCYRNTPKIKIYQLACTQCQLVLMRVWIHAACIYPLCAGYVSLLCVNVSRVKAKLNSTLGMSYDTLKKKSDFMVVNVFCKLVNYPWYFLVFQGVRSKWFCPDLNS